jgi:mannose-6-phosphate isomerase
VADHGADQSLVANGPLAGTPLCRLVQQRGRELLGRHAPLPQFPLLFKYLDCQRDLSVQVHPDDAAAALLDPPDLGKTEAWLILDAAPGSRVYAGLKFGFTRESLAHELAAGRAALGLNSFEPRVGDCIFIPAGTVHALGAGLLVAEIQQASDTTYRLFDWNRTGPDGQPRKLHIEEALDAIDYTAHVVTPQQPHPTERAHIQRLVECDKFVLDRWLLTDQQPLGGDDRFHILSVLAGELFVGSSQAVESRGSTTSDEVSLLSLIRGQTVLIPASLPGVTLAPRGECTLLDRYLP